MKFKNFLWDFDGTLFDSYPHMIAAFEKMLLSNGIPYDHDTALTHLSDSFKSAYDKYALTDEQAEEFLRYERTVTLPPATVPFDGAAAVLRAIVENGGQNYLYTHRDTQAGAYLRWYGLDSYFSGIVDASMHFPLKPAPDGVEHICRVYDLNKEETVMIGDREIDVLAGIRGGVAGCLFSDNPSRIAATAAGYHAPDMYTLADIMEISLGEADRPARRAEFLTLVRNQCAHAAAQLIESANLKAGQTVVVGCSSSEVIGHKIGQVSSPDVAAVIFDTLYGAFSARGIYLAAQCCEHLNRALIIDRAAWRGEEIVNVVPMPKAGGAFATAAYRTFADPVAITEIRADAGLDIGGTMIGMHLKRVAVPLRLEIKQIGEAALSAARVRPPFAGGERAMYDTALL